MISTLDHFKRYPKLITCLLNIHYHLSVEKYDFPLIICGDTGNGKSMLALHLLELWIRLFKNRQVKSDDIKYVAATRINWVKNFKEFNPLDMNINDEGADGMMSKEQITKFGRDIQKLYNVFRKRLFFTVILIPDYFDLPLYFRKRVRGCIWVNKRGQFKYYTGKGLKYLNALNEGKYIKVMTRAFPFFTDTFPDYQGVLRKPYDDMAGESTDKILDEIIASEKANVSSKDIYFDRVTEMLGQGISTTEIAKELKMSLRTVYEIKKISDVSMAN